MDKEIDRTIEFITAQYKAEKEGQKEFQCPLCGGTAWWGRAPSNGHLHCKCRKCGFSVMA